MNPKPQILLITNVPVPYRYQLYHSFCNSGDFDGRILFDSLSHGETWSSQLGDGVRYSVLGGQSVSTETGRMPIHLNLLRQLFKRSPDVVVLSDFSPLFIVQTFLYLMLSSKSVRLVSMTDENRDFFNKLNYRWIRLLFRKFVLSRSTACICCSESSKRHIEAISGRMKGRTYVSYLTPEASYYEASAPPATDGGVIELLTVCRLVDLKRVDRVIRAARMLKDKGISREWRLTIVGDGPERANLQRLADSLGLESHVVFLGRLVGEDIQQAYRKADIFVLTSHKEPWGVVVHEAMLNGLAPIVTRAVGASEMVSGAGGVVVDDRLDEPSLVYEIAGAMEALIDNPSRLREIREQSREYARQITIEREVDSYLAAVK
jgi:glycosyltransferase involved in cell wall biosynthesis